MKNPVSGLANICLYCRKVPISYSHHQFPINFFVLDFNEFEILLGMKWLTKYEAKLDCNNRTISVRIKFEIFIVISCEDLSPKRDKLIYTLGYPELSLGSIPIVRESPDVFEYKRGIGCQ